ncbi:hypothetical protein AWC05_21475 [Mycobacterium florentinum]|uniref:Membrane transport protein MMPL domain-containing protein n=1 Tax=Mycobacterium florentinum TaxID=292462 RepID=A0A1X1U5I8_MYCFL|nr:hypothetical protein [Mycobacterium florentinum]ORV52112.1 hypothetical protein AWC05_21475 [Mycobacterium florentinum]BBX79605.1 hypothetical protein MFLOJ_33920 [Mycobacterium florentinum]
MGDHVVHFAGDAPSLVGGRVLGQLLLGLDLLGQQQPLGLVVPSIVALLGRWFWWPGGIPRRAATSAKMPEHELVRL